VNASINFVLIINKKKIKFIYYMIKTSIYLRMSGVPQTGLERCYSLPLKSTWLRDCLFDMSFNNFE